MRLRSVCLLFAMIAVCVVSLSLAPNPQAAADGKVKAKVSRPMPMMLTPAREAAAHKFAELNHPELAKLLVNLKSRNRNAYNRAMRQLYRDSERLARVSERQPGERYKIMLNSWKVDSRIRLLTAQVYSLPRANPRLKAELDVALGERVDLQIRQMNSERRRLAERLRKLDASIEKLQNGRDVAMKQQLQRVKRSLGLKSGMGRRKSNVKSRVKKSSNSKPKNN